MTIEEMAKELGVSKSTVSRALSGKGRIGEETRQRIRSYAQKKGVWPKRAARRHKTGNISVVLPMDAYTISIPFFQECLLGISESASSLNYQVMVTAGSIQDISGIRTLAESGKTDGIILMQSSEDDRRLKYLTDIHFPTGLVGACGFPEVIQADSDSREAAESLTSMLIDRGYQRPVMMASSSTYKAHIDRCRGFCSALEKHGLPKEHQILYANLTDMSVLDSVIDDIFTRKADCIVCADDCVCTMLMSRLLAGGYRIPKDISIASLCSSPSLEYFFPAVTAVNIFPRKLGNVVGSQLINYLLGNEFCFKTMLDYDIQFRKSAWKPYQA